MIPNWNNIPKKYHEDQDKLIDRIKKQLEVLRESSNKYENLQETVLCELRHLDRKLGYK